MDNEEKMKMQEQIEMQLHDLRAKDARKLGDFY